MSPRAWWVPAAVAVLALLAGAGQPWVAAGTDDPVLGGTTVQVTGAQVGRTVVAAALLGGAATVAGLVGGRVVRLLASACLTLAGVLVAVQAGSAVTDPAGAAEQAVSERTARSGGTVLVDQASAAPWAWVALLAAALLLVSAAACLVSALRGPRRGAGEDAERPRRPAAGGDEPESAWDELSRGRDPTDPR